MPQKILVIRFSSIGDIVLTSPVVRCLHNQIQDVEIHFLTKKKFSLIAESNPNIDRVFVIEKSVSEVLPLLRKESYDLVIDLHNNLRSHLVTLSLRRPFIRFDKLNLKKWLLVKFKKNKMPGVHIVDRYMKTVEHLGVMNDGLGLDFYIPRDQEVDIESLPVPFNNGYIGFVIGGMHNTKILPTDKILEICIDLKFPVVLLGGQDDAARGEEISGMAGNHIYNACGKYNLMQSASLVKQAMAIVSNDTGLMHIAAAFRKRLVSIWGSTVPEFGMTPYMPGESNQYISEVHGLPCRPCSKIGFDKCPEGHFNCMRNQNKEAIVDFTNQGLS